MTDARTAVDADFEFDFPNNLQVTTGLSESPQHTKLVLWGPENKVIHKLDDLPPEPESEAGLGPAGRRSNNTKLLVIVNLVLLGGVAIYLLLRRRA